MVSFWVLWVCQAFMVSFALASNAYGIHKCYVKCTHCLVFIKYYEGRGNHLYHPSGQETVCSGSRKTLFEPVQKRLSEVSMPFTMCFTRQIQRSKLVPIQKEVNTIRIYHCIKEGEKQPEKVHNVVSAAGVVGILEHNKFLANWNFPRLRRKKKEKHGGFVCWFQLHEPWKNEASATKTNISHQTSTKVLDCKTWQSNDIKCLSDFL